MVLPDARAPAAARPRRRWRRRLLWVGAVAGLLLAVVVAVGGWLYARADISTADRLSFTNPLRIPELDEGRRGEDGLVRFDLDVQAGTTPLRPGEQTATWGVNGTHLGPTLRAQRGDRVEVAVTNGVDEVTSLHWHGMTVPAAMDGGPHQPIAPGATWRPTWQIDQPAASLWYHPHPHGATADHVGRGVAGMFIVDDPGSAARALPDEYGVDDIPLLVQDRSFDGDNQFATGERLLAGVGPLGDELLVNGTHDPHLVVTTERVRLRLLNASLGRVFEFGFVDGRPLTVVGTDGGLLERPVTTDRVALTPGERAEVVVTFEPGRDAVLRSFPHDGGADFFTERLNGRDDTFDVLQFRPADRLAPSPPVPSTLADVERLDPSEAVAARTFELAGTRINGRSMSMTRIDAVVEAGTTETWEIRNVDGQLHNFHVHDVQFQVVSIDGGPPPPILRGWKDTIALRAGSRAQLVIRFGDHTDPDRPYMFHCHLLAHEDGGMMGQFVVVEPGGAAGTIDGHAGHRD